MKYKDSSKLNESQKCFSQAIYLDAKYEMAWNNKGICLMK
jgi:hypothetical protein